MKIAAILVAAGLALGTAAPAFADDVSDAEVEKIMEALAEIKCEMDPDEIEKEDDGYELDDVFCEDGQYDIEMNLNFEVIKKVSE